MSELVRSPDVYGIETEYSALITLMNNTEHELVGKCHSTDLALGLYKEPSRKGTDAVTIEHRFRAVESLDMFINGLGMMSNGGRFYIDPSGPEYATAETTTAEEAVLRSFDGDEIMLGVFDYLAQNGVIKGFQLNRRIVDHNRTSRGIHLNTATHIQQAPYPDKKVIDALATINVVKGAIFGSGGLLMNKERKTEFHHSPRLSLTDNVSSTYMDYRLRPLVRVPFKDDVEGLRRIETVTSDALNFAWPLRASLVVTNALVKLIELGHISKLPGLQDHIKAAHTVGQHGNGEQIDALNRYGEPIECKPLDLMQEFCEQVLLAHESEGHLDKESQQVIGEVMDVADAMAKDPETVAKQVESVARLITMQKKMEKDKLTLESERMCRFDYAWDKLGGGIAEMLRSGAVKTEKTSGWLGFSNKNTPVAAKKRIKTPPQDTRAKIRGDGVRETEGANHSSWHVIDFDGFEVPLHPLTTSRP